MKDVLKRLIEIIGPSGPAKKTYRAVVLTKRSLFAHLKSVFRKKDRLTIEINAAFALIGTDDHDKAAQSIKSLYERHPDHTLVAWGQGIILRREGKPEQAIAVLSGSDDARLIAECTAAQDTIHRKSITDLITQTEYAKAGEYIVAHKDKLSKLENISLLMQSVAVCKKQGTVNSLLDTLCTEFLPGLEEEADPLLVQLYTAVSDVHNSEHDPARARIADFVATVDPDQTYLWPDHIRSVAIYFLNIQMAAECAALFDVLHQSERFKDTAACRYNHGYSMIAYARLNDAAKIRHHGVARLHILQSTPSALLPEIFGAAADLASKQIDKGTAPEIVAQALITSLAGKLPSLEIIIETLDVCLSQIPAMLSFQRTYTINPLCMGASVKPVRQLQEDIVCLYAQCETTLLIAQQIDSASVPVLLRLLQLYLYQEEFEKAGVIRAKLAPLITSPQKHIEVVRYDVRASEDKVSSEGRQRFTLHSFATWLDTIGCQDAEVICEQTEKTLEFLFFETAEPSVINYTYTSPELRIGTVKNVTCLDAGVAVNDHSQAIADDFLFPECAALPAGTFVASDKYALLRTDRPQWIAPDDCAAFLDMPIFRNEFYHTVAQYLSRLALLHKNGLLEGRKLLVPDSFGGGAYAVLDAMGISREQLVLAPSGHDVRLNTALMPSPGFEMRKPQRAEMYALRDLILSHHGASGPQDQKIYISRRTLNNRILTNEPELEAIAQKLGYVVVQPETLPFNDQVALFSRAKVIVGSTGAGLVNMVHAPAGATVICMTIKDHAIDFWPVMANDLGHDFAFLAGQPFFPNAPVQVQTFDFKVDPAVFKSVLRAY